MCTFIADDHATISDGYVELSRSCDREKNSIFFTEKARMHVGRKDQVLIVFKGVTSKGYFNCRLQILKNYS